MTTETLPPEQRHELEAIIETITFLAQQTERVQLSIAHQSEELARLEHRVTTSTDLLLRKAERMGLKRDAATKQLVNRLTELKTSVVHHGKVYLARDGHLIVYPVDVP